MTNIALTLPAERQYRRRQSVRSLAAVTLTATIYAAFGLSVAFSFAMVLGLIH